MAFDQEGPDSTGFEQDHHALAARVMWVAHAEQLCTHERLAHERLGLQ